MWTTEFRRKSCPTDCAPCPEAAMPFCQSKEQARAPSNRSHLLQKNSSVLLTEVGFHLNLDLKEPILSFSSFSESCIFHPRSFPLAAQKRALPCSPLKCHWYFLPILLAWSWKDRSGLPCANPEHPLLTTLGLWQAGLCPLDQGILTSALHICLQSPQ